MSDIGNPKSSDLLREETAKNLVLMVSALIPFPWTPVKFGVIALLGITLGAYAHQPSEGPATGAKPAPELQVNEVGNYWWLAFVF